MRSAPSCRPRPGGETRIRTTNGSSGSAVRRRIDRLAGRLVFRIDDDDLVRLARRNELRDRQKLDELRVIELLFYAQLRNQEVARVCGIDEKQVALLKFRALDSPLSSGVCSMWTKKTPLRTGSKKGTQNRATARTRCPDCTLTKRYVPLS